MSNAEEKNLNKNEYGAGVLAILGCEVSWGVLPLYWNAFDVVDSRIIILYRIFLVFLTALIVAMAVGRSGPARFLAPLKDRKILKRYFIAGVTITINWSIYIWGINNGYIIQSTIGYYIQPLVLCIFGIFMFKEKLTRYKIVAIALAVVGLAVIIWHFKEVPSIALLIALTFAFYSVIKKGVDEPPLTSLVCETCFFAPFALAAVLFLEIKGIGALAVAQPYQYALLLLCGLMTVIPLGLFARGAKRVPLILLGLAGYISPTITLLIGIFWLREPFDKVELISFIIIWIGLAYFSYGEIKAQRAKG